MKTAADNRLLMPQCSRIVDEFREAFGADDVKVLYAAENNITLGRPGRGEPESTPTEAQP